MANKLRTLGVFAFGAGVGAGVALLFAPRSGKQTRRRLRNSANHAIHRLEDVQEEVQSYMTEWVEEASEKIASGVAAGKETAHDALKTVKECMEDGKERVERYIRTVAG